MTHSLNGPNPVTRTVLELGRIESIREGCIEVLEYVVVAILASSLIPSYRVCLFKFMITYSESAHQYLSALWILSRLVELQLSQVETFVLILFFIVQVTNAFSCSFRSRFIF